MGFPLALKNFLTLKIRPERSEGRKFLNFGLSCLHKNCSKFFQILAILDLYFGSKKQVLPKQKNVIIHVFVKFLKNPQVYPTSLQKTTYESNIALAKANASVNIFESLGKKFQKIFKIENFGFLASLGGRRGIRFWARSTRQGRSRGRIKGEWAFPQL